MKQEIINALEGCIKKLHLNPKERIALDELINRKIQVHIKKVFDDFDMIMTIPYLDESQEGVRRIFLSHLQKFKEKHLKKGEDKWKKEQNN